MMQRLVLVVNTGGSEGLSMVKGIRSAGVFCTMTDAARLDVPEEAKGVVVIGGPSEYARPCLRKLLDRQLPILAFGDPAARLCEELGGQVTGPCGDEPAAGRALCEPGRVPGRRRGHAHAAERGVPEPSAGLPHAERRRGRDAGL